MNRIKIAGIEVSLSSIHMEDLKGLNIDSMIRFTYYMGHFNGSRLCFVVPKTNTRLTPLKCRRYADNIGKVLHFPIVFILDSATYLNRARLIEQGVYFVVSEKYAFIPTLLINAVNRERKSKRKKILSPAAQYILLYYLQSQLPAVCTIKDFEVTTPFSYQSIGRAIMDLEHFGLCRSEIIPHVEKRIYFHGSRKELWEKSLSCLRNPVRWIYYTNDDLPALGIISGINALSHYSHLNPEEMQTVAVSEKDFKECIKNRLNLNDVEGNSKIEVWIYPPEMPFHAKYADKLSLYLSLQEEHDARVEKELEIIIEKMPW